MKRNTDPKSLSLSVFYLALLLWFSKSASSIEPQMGEDAQQINSLSYWWFALALLLWVFKFRVLTCSSAALGPQNNPATKSHRRGHVASPQHRCSDSPHADSSFPPESNRNAGSIANLPFSRKTATIAEEDVTIRSFFSGRRASRAISCFLQLFPPNTRINLRIPHRFGNGLG